MHTETPNTPRTTQAAALNHQALTPNEGGQAKPNQNLPSFVINQALLN